MAQANPADPADRVAAGSLWTGVKEQSAAAEDAAPNGRASQWQDFRDAWRAQAMILFMVLLFAGLTLIPASR
jgi:hypothetical protein